MARPKKREANKSLFIELYPKLQGNVSAICGKVGVSRRTFYDWMRDDEKFKEDIETIDIDDLKLDVAEHQLLQLIKEKDFRAVKFFLEKKGASRGYGESNEVKHSGSIALEAKPVVNFTKPKQIEDDE